MTDSNGAASRGNWKTFALGDLADFINGRAFKPSEWGSTGLPIIRIQNLTSPAAEANFFDGALDQKHRIDTGDLLVSWSASLDAFLWDRGPAALNQHIFKVSENSRVVDRSFLYFALRAMMGSIRDQIHGSTMQHITKPKFLATRISAPESLAQQRGIAAELTERLHLAGELHIALERQRKAVAEASGAVLRRSLERVHGGAVEEVLLGAVLSKSQYGLSLAGNRVGVGTPMLRMGNIQDSRLELRDLVYVEIGDSDRDKYRLQRGDVLIVRTSGSAAHVGKAAVFDRDEEFVFASYLIRLQPDRRRCLPEYLHAVLTSSIGREYIGKIRHQVGQNNINATEIRKMPLPLPPLHEQQAVVEELRSAQATIDEMTAAVDRADGASRALSEVLLREVFHPALNLEEAT